MEDHTSEKPSAGGRPEDTRDSLRQENEGSAVPSDAITEKGKNKDKENEESENALRSKEDSEATPPSPESVAKTSDKESENSEMIIDESETASSSLKTESKTSELLTCNWDRRNENFLKEYKELLASEDKMLKLDSHAETLCQLKDFQKELVSSAEDKFPENYYSLLAKMCQDKPTPLTKLSKEIYKAIIPEEVETPLSLLTIAEAIVVVCERKCWGVKRSKVVQNEDASSDSRWRWEASTLEFLPQDQRVLLKNYRKDRRHKLKRINAYGKFFALMKKDNRDDSKLSIAAEKIVKFNREHISKCLKRRSREGITSNQIAKKAKKEQREKQKKEREAKLAQKKAETEKRKFEAQKKKEDMRRKKEEAKRKKDEVERKKMEKQKKIEATLRKQSSSFASFFKITQKKKQDVEEVQMTVGRFHKWETPPNTTMAPVLPHKTTLTMEEMEKEIRKGGASVKLSFKPAKRKYNKISRSKLLQYHEDVRPPWWGKHPLVKCEQVSGRRPFGRSSELDYDNDSEAEWEAEPNDGEELRSDDEDQDEEEISEKKDGVRQDGLEEDGWLIAEDDPEYDGGLGAGSSSKVTAVIYGPIFDLNPQEQGDAGKFLAQFQGQFLDCKIIDCAIKDVDSERKERKEKKKEKAKEKRKEKAKEKKKEKAKEKEKEKAKEKEKEKAKEKKKDKTVEKGKEKTKKSSEINADIKMSSKVSQVYTKDELETLMKAAKEFTRPSGKVNWKELLEKYQFPGRTRKSLVGKYNKMKKKVSVPVTTAEKESSTGAEMEVTKNGMETEKSPAKDGQTPNPSRKRKPLEAPPDTKGRATKRAMKKKERTKNMLTIKNLFQKQSMQKSGTKV
eukprot:jgi/Bigna1/87962/estExt_fgenesh1_pg.C_260110